MNLPLDRETLVQGTVIAAMCVGTWIFAIQPRARELEKLHERLPKDVSAGLHLDERTITELAGRIGDIRTRLQHVQSANDMAGDSPRLYGLVMDLADAHNVSIATMQPGASQGRAASEGVSASRLELSAAGGYEQIARFIQAVAELPAFVRPLSLQLTPVRVDGRPSVTVRFACEFLSFKIDDTLKSLAGADHAQP